MALLRKHSLRDGLNVRNFFDRFFDEALVRPDFFGSEFYELQDIPVDMVEDGNDLVVKASVPGVKPEALHIEVNEDVLRIWAEANEEKESKEGNYHLRERAYGRLERVLSLPYQVNAENAKAEFKDGVVHLTLPKIAETKRKEIKLNVSA